MSDGQLMVGVCGSSTVTRKTQGPPVSPTQMTFELPSGKDDPEGGVQATVPQSLPADVAAKLTTAAHWPAAFCVTMSDGQVTSQVVVVLSGIVTEAVKVLSLEANSAVSLETVAVLDTAAPGSAPASTWKMKVNCAVTFAGSVAIVQVELPVAPAIGFVQVAAGPEVCVSDMHVELVATATTSWPCDPSFGPLAV